MGFLTVLSQKCYGVWGMRGYGVCSKIPAYQLGNSKILWDIGEYGLRGVWVKGVTTVALALMGKRNITVPKYFSNFIVNFRAPLDHPMGQPFLGVATWVATLRRTRKQPNNHVLLTLLRLLKFRTTQWCITASIRFQCAVVSVNQHHVIT